MCLHFQQAPLCNSLTIDPIRLLIITTMVCKFRQHFSCMSKPLNGISFSFLFSLIFCHVLRFLFYHCTSLSLYASLPPTHPLLRASPFSPPPNVSSENNFVRVDLEQFVIRSHFRLLSARKVNNYLKNKPENVLIISMLYFDCQIF